MCITFETVSKENTVLEKIEIKSGQYDEKERKKIMYRTGRRGFFIWDFISALVDSILLIKLK